MPKPTIKINQIIKSEQVLNAFIQIVRPDLQLDLQNTRITAEDILYALAYADVHRLSIASICQELREAPSETGCGRSWWKPARSGRVQCALNRMFYQQLHPSLLKGNATTTLQSI